MKLHMEDLYQKLKNGLSNSELILDVREADDFAEAHVPGSRSIPYDRILANPEWFKKEFQSYLRVYIHCGGGGKAGRVYEALSAAGATNIVHICDSGMRSWIAAGHPIQSESSAKKDAE
jgi:rhodanese-related sulfurtransferase